MKKGIDKGNLKEVKAIGNDIAANDQKIKHYDRRADCIVKGMLQHSHSSNGIKKHNDINMLADEYLRLAYYGLRVKDKSFDAIMKNDVDESIGKINIVPQDIRRVILNLMTNAFFAVTEKLTAESLKPKAEGKGYEPVVSVTTRRLNYPSVYGNKIKIIVKDNGNGIPENVMEKIFHPFLITTPTGQGTGLYLSMSYNIVIKGHGNRLTAETIEEEGSQFIIILPP